MDDAELKALAVELRNFDAGNSPDAANRLLDRAAGALESVVGCAAPVDHEDMIYAAYLGILVLEAMCRKSGLSLGEQRCKDLLVELNTAYPHFAGRSALREAPLPTPPKG